MPENYSDVNVSTLRALAESHRLEIVELLRRGPLAVGEITKQLGLKQPQTSKHLKVLCENGIVDVKVEANSRIYSLRPEPFQALDAWIHSFRRIMQERYDKLDDYLKKARRDDHDQP